MSIISKQAPASLHKLFTPITIGSMTVKNRLVMAPITTNYGTKDQEPSPRLLAYLETRAKGGVGLITVEVCSVDTDHRYQLNSLSLGDDKYIEHHKKIVEVIHRHGAKAQPQITHPGPESMSLWVEKKPMLGPSEICGLGNRSPCRALGVDELDGIIEQYAQAARRAKEAGYDGMELHAAHAYMLLASFLSPWRNRRRDEYGKTPENRYRLLVRVIKRIKEVVGADFPITLRISGFERLKGGREINETQAFAPMLVEAGIDAFHLSGGNAGDFEAATTICGSDFPFGYNVAAAEALKQVVDVPVFAVGRIHDPRHAEEILQNNSADMIVMGRPLLADPELPLKAQAGRFDDIRRCISCQNCVDTLMVNDMNCAVNPMTGRELEFGFTQAVKRKKVLIIGGGTAGMEAARIAAIRGHQVILCEKSKRLGGSLTLASTVHSDNEMFLTYLLQQMKVLPIECRYGQEVNLQFVNAINPDCVIVATGAVLKSQPLEGMDLPNVLSGAQLRSLLVGETHNAGNALPFWMLKGLAIVGPYIQKLISPKLLREGTQLWMPIGKRVAILGADLAGVELAEFLAKRGRKVYLLDENNQLAPEVGLRRRSDHMDNLDKLGVIINTGIVPKRITSTGFTFENQLGKDHHLKVDTVLLAGEPVANQTLYEAIKIQYPEVYAIGDCTGLGLIAGATTDAMKVASVI